MKAMILDHQNDINESPLLLVNLAAPVPAEREIRIRVPGYHANGGFAEFACVYEDYAYAIPESYERQLFYEKNIHSVAANTREDGEELLKVAAAMPIKPQVHMYTLDEANRALQDLKADRIQGTGCLQIADVL